MEAVALICVVCVVIFLVTTVFGLITEKMGDNKNISNCFWWGFLLGILGIIIVSLKKKQLSRREAAIAKLIEQKTLLDSGIKTQAEFDTCKEKLALIINEK
tara:strand:- start:296 stop:598 length:303 start_codon:yes stop_codon:yes gene_type:complete